MVIISSHRRERERERKHAHEKCTGNGHAIWNLPSWAPNPNPKSCCGESVKIPRFHLHVRDIINTMLIEKSSYYVLANTKPICHSLAFAITTFWGFRLSAGVYEFLIFILIIWASFCQV